MGSEGRGHSAAAGVEGADRSGGGGAAAEATPSSVGPVSGSSIFPAPPAGLLPRVAAAARALALVLPGFLAALFLLAAPLLPPLLAAADREGTAGGAAAALAGGSGGLLPAPSQAAPPGGGSAPRVPGDASAAAHPSWNVRSPDSTTVGPSSSPCSAPLR
eukprot:CAMPEP_0177616392 /NCGR_PEP_ID=MMETSP0419_2-20121207/24122_1 /TAXON_ID=582737 /ORGANISM="Tetraselmis sp., Strain GSL018" /LENGTH=159 /DNA_ID=CAMNT_0019114429 /DNA_START=321 /DNA_END=802 /DNA_ORIENTATION=-